MSEEETPPHAWGRLAVAVGLVMLVGNTPTCVGKTRRTARGSAIRKKHPHMRGEDDSCGESPLVSPETPPHAWGRPPHGKGRGQNGGNTPTCVGKTERAPAQPRRSEKHPHMRGEDLCDLTIHGETIETPPHAWGRRERLLPTQLGYRNTPTCVGKTFALHDDTDLPKETPPHAWGRRYSPPITPSAW